MSDDKEPKLSKTVLGEAWENADEIDLDDPKVKKAVTVIAREMAENREQSFWYRVKKVFSDKLPEDSYKGFLWLVSIFGTAAVVYFNVQGK